MDEKAATDSNNTLGERLYAFLRRESHEAPESLFADDFVGHLTTGLPLDLGGDYHGRDDMVVRAWGRVLQAFSVQPELHALYLPNPDVLIGTGVYVGEARLTGKQFRAEFTHFWGVRETHIVSLRQITDSGAWRDALSAPLFWRP